MQQSPQPPRYFYRDAELPFGFTLDASYSKDVFARWNKFTSVESGKYNVHLYFNKPREFGFDDWFPFSIDLYDAQGLESYLKQVPESYSYWLSTSSVCFDDVPYEKEGIKTIFIRFFNQMSLTRHSVPAKVYTFKTVSPGCETAPCAETDIYWIIINEAPHLPQGKAIRIRIEFPTMLPKGTSYDWDKPETIKLKKRTTQFLCDTAKSFVWVNFGDKFSSERWKEVKWIEAPQPEVHISDEREK